MFKARNLFTPNVDVYLFMKRNRHFIKQIVKFTINCVWSEREPFTRIINLYYKFTVLIFLWDHVKCLYGIIKFNLWQLLPLLTRLLTCGRGQEVSKFGKVITSSCIRLLCHFKSFDSVSLASPPLLIFITIATRGAL